VLQRFADLTPTRTLGCITLLATAVLALLALASRGAAPLAIVPFIAPAELRLEFASTTLALPFFAIVAFIVPAVAFWGLSRGSADDGFRLAAFILAMLGVFLAQSVAAFFLAWEAMSLVSAFLVGTHHERRDVRRALLSYIVVSQLGALCILAALALLGQHAGSYRFADIGRAAAALGMGPRSAAIGLALVGFGSKAGLVPLHSWLPLAHPVAPANASALLSGIMLKVAVYGLLLIGFVLAAPVPLAWSIAVLGIGLLTTFTGALYAAVDSDFKRLLAYSSCENLGIIVSALGLALGAAALRLPALANIAFAALLLHALSHAAFKSLLFLGAGNVADSTHTTDLEHLGGLGRALPQTAALVLVGCCAAAALPPLTGFASEWLIFTSFVRGLGEVGPGLQMTIAGAIGVLAIASGLAALAFAKLFGIAFLGEPRTSRPIARETGDASVLGLGWLAFLCIAFGLAPALVLRPLIGVASALSGYGILAPGPLPTLPVLLAVLPCLGGGMALVLARRRGVRSVPTWTCGSSVTPRSQYTAAAFSKPIRRIFGFVVFPDHQKISDVGTSRWFPVRIRYEFTTRYIVDEAARNVAAFTQRFARRMRIVQAGLLRVYLVYAVVAVLIVLIVAR
jgi:formate hydrogenlyase subunit 3/multisubunit Na+/H+ antiporter MnhD subunit